MAAHSLGPWTVPHFATSHGCKCGYVFDSSGNYMGAVATVHFNDGRSIEEGGGDDPPIEEAKANARLIAAAPDLLEALQNLLTLSENADETGYVDGEGWLPMEKIQERARQAIAKATQQPEESK